MKILNEFLRKNLIFLCFLIIVLQFLQIVYLNRSIFVVSYDASYWKDRLEHSQWGLPASNRIVGDDGIYNYAGVQLMQGLSIEQTFANKPPVGIYLIGLSIVLFKNPAFFGLLTGLSTLVCFLLLSKEILNDKKLAFVASTLLVLDPFIFVNFYHTLLDLLQLFLLILHLLFFIYFLKKKNNLFLFAAVSGLALGLFTETKPPLVLPIIILLEAFYIFRYKQWKLLIGLFVGFCIGVIVPYFRYFEFHHSLVDYLRLHKYMASIYYNGKNQVHHLAILQAMFMGLFPDVSNGKLMNISDWWIIQPIVSFIGIIFAIRAFFVKNLSLVVKGIALFVLVQLIIYSNISSYPRYLLLVIPFLYLFAVIELKKFIHKTVFFIVFFAVALAAFFHASFLLFPSPSITLSDFYYNISHQYFHDIYQEDISKNSKKEFAKEQFRYIAQTALAQATVKNIQVEELSRSIPVFGKSGEAIIKITYSTQYLGAFSEHKTIHLVNEDGQWKVQWDWNTIMNGFVPHDSFVATVSYGKRGSILDKDAKVLVNDQPSFLILVNPDQIDTKREQEMLLLLYEITRAKVFLQNAYLENTLPSSYIPIATPFIQVSKKQEEKLIAFPGLRLDPTFVRIYSTNSLVLPSMIGNTLYEEKSTRIYSSTNYHGIFGPESKFDKTLSGQDGGAIKMIDSNGKTIRTPIRKEAKNGTDIILQ